MQHGDEVPYRLADGEVFTVPKPGGSGPNYMRFINLLDSTASSSLVIGPLASWTHTDTGSPVFYRRPCCLATQYAVWDVVKAFDILSRPQLFQDIQASAAEWHEEFDQHPWAQRWTCTNESGTLLPSAVPLATRRHADDLARTSIARSYMELNDIHQFTTSSLSAALGRRALQLHPKKGGHATAASG